MPRTTVRHGRQGLIASVRPTADALVDRQKAVTLVQIETDGWSLGGKPCIIQG